MTTVTTPSGVITPRAVQTIETQQETGNIVHNLIGGGVDVTFRPPRPRSGQIQMLFASLPAANACRVAHGLAGAFVLNDAALSLTYVPEGRITVEVDARVDDAWWVVVPFQELP